jgi:hypothetical protein
VKLPPDLEATLIVIGSGMVLARTSEGPAFIAKAPRAEIDQFRGRLPVDVRHELHLYSGGPAIRVVIKIHDKPGSYYAFETFLDVGLDSDRVDYYTMIVGKTITVHFYDEKVEHILTKKVRIDPVGRDHVMQLYRRALNYYEQTPPQLRNFLATKAEVLLKSDI